MSTKIFPKGLEGFADGSLDWDTDTMKCALLNPVADTSVKAITGATNATPAVLTAASHGLTVDDVVLVTGVLGNLAVNQLALVNTVPDGNTFTLKTLHDGLVVQGSGAYTSGGWLINLTTAQFRAAVDAGEIGTPQALGSKTKTNGELDAADVAFTGITSGAVAAYIYKDNGSAAADRMAILHDGKIQVVVAANAASSATSIAVEKLTGPIPSGTTLVFSNGASATLSGAASIGDRTLAVNALAAGINAGHTAEAVSTNSGLPFSYSGPGVNVNITWGAYIARL